MLANMGKREKEITGINTIKKEAAQMTHVMCRKPRELTKSRNRNDGKHNRY